MVMGWQFKFYLNSSYSTIAMKYLKQISLIPVVALIVAGCSGPTAMQSSTETDDLYYTSTDKTVYASKQSSNINVTETTTNERESVAANTGSNQDEVANPEYSSNSARSSGNVSTSSDYDYYSDDYTYASRIRRFNGPYRGLSYYDFAYTDPYWYGSSFYGNNPFYDPFSYRPGFYSGLSLGIGFGNPFYSPIYGGYGNYGGYYRPYGNYYNGYRNGFHNGYSANNGNYERYPINNSRPRNYGPRNERSVVPVTRDNAGTRRIGNTNGANRVADNPGGRPARIINGGGIAAPNTGNTSGVRTPDNAGTVQPQGRSVRGSRRTDAGTVTSPNSGQPARMGNTAGDNNVYRPSSRPARRFETTTTNEPTPAPPSFPTEVQRPSRSRRVMEQPQRRNAETPRYEAPRREQRTQEISRPEPAPQRNDSWSQPSRSAPSSSPANNGGGSSGGGRPRRN